MKILVTGAHGMVGRNLLEHPLAAQHQMLSPTRQLVNWADRSQTNAYLKEHRPDLIVHAAGRVGGIQANVKNPAEFLSENLKLNLSLLESAVEVGVPRLINLGSSCIYPRNHSDALTEEMILNGPLEPTNEGYAIAKIAALKYCEYLHRTRPEFQYKTLIPCNLYGRHDKFDPELSHLIPAIIHKIHHAQKTGGPVRIWGDGKARREFMDAADLADAIFFAVERLEKLPDQLNVGSGIDHSVREYYEAVAKVIGFKGDFEYDLNKPVGMTRKLTSIAKITKLGWKAKTSLEDGIRKAYDYYLTLDQAK